MRFKNASWEPIAWMNAMVHTHKTQFTIHITAGRGDPRTIESWRSYASGGTQSAGANVVVFRDGRAVQCSDSSCKSAADRGATHTISFECVGLDGDSLTTAQILTIVKLIHEANQGHGVPLRLARTSSDAGIGWHRLGVDGNFPYNSRYSGRLQRSPLGVKTSGAFGKACPTNRFIDQIHDVILPMVLNGAPAIPAGGEGEWDEMVDEATLTRIVREVVEQEKPLRFVHFSYDGSVCEANLDDRTWYRFPNKEHMDTRKTVLDRLDIKRVNWQNAEGSSAVDNPTAAFGTELPAPSTIS